MLVSRRGGRRQDRARARVRDAARRAARCCGAPATRSSRRARSARSPTSRRAAGGELAPLVAEGAPPYAVAGSSLRELGGRAPDDRRDRGRCTGPTRRRSTCCGCSAAASTGVPALRASRRTATTSSTAAHPLRIALGDLLAPRGDPAARARPAVAGGASPSWPARTASTPPSSTARTAGNPFFVTEALAAGGVALPATVRDAVLARAPRLSPRARQVLDAVGDRAPHASSCWLLEALAGDARPQLDDCLPRRAAAPSGAGVAFRHELARVAIEESLAPRPAAGAAPPRARARSPRSDAARPRAAAHHAEGAADAAAVLRFAPGRRRARRGRRRAPRGGRAVRPRRSLRRRRPRPAERAGLHERRSHECYLDRPARRGDARLRRGDGVPPRARRPPRRGRRAPPAVELLWCPGDDDARGGRRRDADLAAGAVGPDPELARAYANLAPLP